MEFIETEQGMRAIALDKVEVVENIGEMRTILVTVSGHVYIIGMPYDLVISIIKKRSQELESTRAAIKNIDANTQSVRL